MSSVATTMGSNDSKTPSTPIFDADKDLPRSSRFWTWLFFTVAPKGFWLLRKWWPIANFFGFRVITRYEDVAEVLLRHDIYRVPFDKEIARLNDWKGDGTPFILGNDDTKTHDEQLMRVMRVFRRDDVKAVVEPKSFQFAKEAIEKAGIGEIEAIGELITGVPLRICEEYYGIKMPEKQSRTFAYATIVVSQYLFGGASLKPKKKVDNAAAFVRRIVDDSLKKAEDGDKTIVERLVKLYGKPNAGVDPQARAFLMGMIVGFIPTNTIAGGHILEMLLRKKVFQAKAREAALSGDDDLLKHCLFEAMRFMPLNLGPFRICEQDHVIAAGTPHAGRIKKGQKVLASTMSAMMDARKVDRPNEFVPSRPASDYMLFGYGIHWCAGVFIAQAQITQTFKALLKHSKLERGSGKAKWPPYRGLFPDYQLVKIR
jgi:cytochrome P450